MQRASGCIRFGFIKAFAALFLRPLPLSLHARLASDAQWRQCLPFPQNGSFLVWCKHCSCMHFLRMQASFTFRPRSVEEHLFLFGSHLLLNKNEATHIGQGDMAPKTASIMSYTHHSDVEANRKVSKSAWPDKVDFPVYVGRLRWPELPVVQWISIPNQSWLWLPKSSPIQSSAQRNSGLTTPKMHLCGGNPPSSLCPSVYI